MTTDRTRLALFIESAEHLHGREWQTPLSAALGVNMRTMQRMAAAGRKGRDWPVAPGLLRELAHLLFDHRERTTVLREALLQAGKEEA